MCVDNWIGTVLPLQDMHASMTEDYGIPVWGSYLVFAIATIIIGLLLGLVSLKLVLYNTVKVYVVSLFWFLLG